MIKLPKAVKVIVVNLILVAALLEAASIGFYYFKTGQFFYTRSARNSADMFPPGAALVNQANTQAERQLHPYFGFIDNPGTIYRFSFSQTNHVANNLGFASAHDYPFRKQNPNQFIVGVFGGSVASNYSLFEIEQSILTQALHKLPALANKEIIVLSFAMGAYKQPQQLLVLNYFLSIGQEFDLVINIDGFNEVALSYLNYQHGYNSSMPCDYLLVPMVAQATIGFSKDELALGAQVLDEKERLADSIASLETNHTATGYVCQWVWIRYQMRRYGQDVLRLNQLLVDKGRPDQTFMRPSGSPPRTEDEAFAEIISLWSRSSLAMKQVLDQKHVPYFEFIQPNQYASTSRVFGSEETSVAINNASDFKAGVVKGYPRLLAEINSLQHQGVQLFSAVNVFDKVSETAYLDDCCHYTRIGNTILSEFIAGTVIEGLSKDARFGRAAGK